MSTQPFFSFFTCNIRTLGFLLGSTALFSSSALAQITAADLVLAMDAPPEVVGSSLILPPTPPLDPEFAAVLPQFGSLRPVRGSDFAMLCTGRVGTELAQPGDELNGAAEVRLTLDIQAPSGKCMIAGTTCNDDSECIGPGDVCATTMNRLGFGYTFLSAEYPEINAPVPRLPDRFTATLTDLSVFPTVGVELIDPADLSLIPAPRSLVSGTVFDVADGSSLPEAGFVKNKVFSAELTSGHLYQLEFVIADVGDSPPDGLNDSCVALEYITVTSLEVVGIKPFLITSVMSDGNIENDPEALRKKGRTVEGAAADGATRVLLRKLNAFASGEVEFCMTVGTAPEDGGLTLLGQGTRDQCVTAPVVFTGVAEGEPRAQAFAVYQAPDEFNRGGDEDQAQRSLTFVATWKPDPSGTTSISSGLTFKLVRPPLYLLHGLWDGGNTWIVKDEEFPLAVDPLKSRYSTYRENYFHFRARYFHRITGAANPYSALKALRDKNIAVTRVDIAGHSMGGNLARRFVEAGVYALRYNFHAGFYHKLVTLDTPHTGSPLADLAVTILDIPCYTACVETNIFGTCTRVGTICPGQIFAQLMADNDQPVDEGALHDLQTCSSAIREIPTTVVPSHALWGAADFNAFPVPGWLKDVYEVMGFFCFCNPVNILFGGENDGVVVASSQEGGLSGTTTTRFDDEWAFHVKNTHAPNYSAQLEMLLNLPSTGPEFGNFPAPSTISPCNGEATSLSTESVEQQQSDIFLTIDFPTSTTPLVPGEIVTAQVSTDTPDITLEEILIAGPLLAVTQTYPPDTPGPYTLQMTIPSAVVGDFEFRASGRDGDGNFFISDSVTPQVTVPALLQEVDIVSEDITLEATQDIDYLRVRGNYNDQVVRDITDPSTGTQFLTTDPNIIDISAGNGQITAIGPGAAVVVATNGIQFDSILVTVLDQRRPTADAGIDLFVELGTTVTLMGNIILSDTPGPGPNTFDWEPTSGPAEVSLSDRFAQNPTFVPTVEGTYGFELIVHDGNLTSTLDTVMVSVLPTPTGDGRGVCDAGGVTDHTRGPQMMCKQ